MLLIGSTLAISFIWMAAVAPDKPDRKWKLCAAMAYYGSAVLFAIEGVRFILNLEGYR